MKTPEEVEALKRSWKQDPCWDIEDTEGFGDHYDELKAFSDQQHQIWEERRTRNMEKKAEELGCPGNVALAAYVERLEVRLTTLEDFMKT